MIERILKDMKHIKNMYELVEYVQRRNGEEDEDCERGELVKGYAVKCNGKFTEKQVDRT